MPVGPGRVGRIAGGGLTRIVGHDLARLIVRNRIELAAAGRVAGRPARFGLRAAGRVRGAGRAACVAIVRLAGSGHGFLRVRMGGRNAAAAMQNALEA
ncbi:hypothetical protein BvRS1_14270 [Burkholderia vietnamiensis]|nr:hypothetical protein BvRS1_14270 [Burkholderia vietnamiensis]